MRMLETAGLLLVISIGIGVISILVTAFVTTMSELAHRGWRAFQEGQRQRRITDDALREFDKRQRHPYADVRRILEEDQRRRLNLVVRNGDSRS